MTRYTTVFVYQRDVLHTNQAATIVSKLISLFLAVLALWQLISTSTWRVRSFHAPISL